MEEFIQNEYRYLSMNAKEQTTKFLEKNVSNIYKNIKKILTVIKKGNKDKTIGQVLLKMEELIENAGVIGGVDTQTVGSLQDQRSSYISNVITTLQRHVQYQVLFIRSFTIQFIGCMANEEAILFSSLTQSKFFSFFFASPYIPIYML